MPKVLRLTFLFLLLICGVTGVNCQESNDPYSTNEVKVMLRQQGLSFGVAEKRVSRLGDRASIALLKVLNENELEDPQKINGILSVIRTAFASPQEIIIAEDRKPKVTLFLLRYIQSKTKDEGLRGKLSELIEFVTSQSNK